MTWLGPVGRPAVRSLQALTAVLTIVVGATVFVGWWLSIDELKSLVPGLLTMKVNTAIGFVLLGVGLLARSQLGGKAWQHVGTASLLAAVLLSVAVGSQYLTGGDSGIDQWLFREPAGQVGTVQPNRMSPMTVICFLFIGGALLLGRSPRAYKVVLTLFLGALLIAALNTLDFVFQATMPSFLAGHTQMALNTSLTTVVLAIGAITLLPNGGPLEVLSGASPSARLARRLLIASLVAPLILAWLRLLGEEHGLYDTRYGASLTVLGGSAFLAIVIWQSARSAQRMEAARSAAVEERDLFFDFSSDMLATASAGGYFVRLNRAWEATLGYELAELYSRPFADFVHPDDREATIVETGLIAEQGKTTLNFQNRYRHRDGSYRWLDWTATPSADGSLIYAAARDVTVRKHEEERQLAPILAAREVRAEAQRTIKATITAERFWPVFQPVVDLSSGLVVGFEALTRFTDGSPPGVRFAAAVECGLGLELERVTLAAALHAGRLLPPHVWISLNVSPAMLLDVTTLRPMLARQSRPIVLEITEHEAICAYGPLRDALARLGPGVRLAVDDAGAGIANFSHLVELRPDFVKIDAGLVRSVDTDVTRAAIVAGLVHFGAAAGCAIIAEGIETSPERATVAALGVRLGQGYLLGRPAEAETWKTRAARGAPILRPRIRSSLPVVLPLQ